MSVSYHATVNFMSPGSIGARGCSFPVDMNIGEIQPMADNNIGLVVAASI
jgi:hypothetical protein